MLSIRGLRKIFAGTPPRVLFDGLQLDLDAGDFVAVMGESGSGKSTLLNLIAGLESPDAGSIRFDGTDLAALAEPERAAYRCRNLGFVFQAFLLLPYLDVADNVALPLLLTGAGPAQRRQRVGEALAQVGMRERAHSHPRELSGGEMQRVAIARALVHRPRLVLADEPTGNLDAEHARQVLALLRDCVKDRSTSCILVTHSTTAAGTADRTFILTPLGLQPATR